MSSIKIIKQIMWKTDYSMTAIKLTNTVLLIMFVFSIVFSNFMIYNLSGNIRSIARFILHLNKKFSCTEHIHWQNYLCAFWVKIKNKSSFFKWMPSLGWQRTQRSLFKCTCLCAYCSFSIKKKISVPKMLHLWMIGDKQ
jgi:hypothetical protein